MSLTSEQIIEAAERLVTVGITDPSVTQVRDALGGCGSRTTITKVVREWKQARLRERNAADALPPELSTCLTSLGTQFWQSAMAHATRLIEIERDALRAATDALRQAESEAALLADRLEAERDTALSRVAELQAALTKAAEEQKTLRRAAADDASRIEELLAECRAAKDAELSAREKAAVLEGELSMARSVISAFGQLQSERATAPAPSP